MFFASDKNYPKFIHKDSIVKSYNCPSTSKNGSFFLLPRFTKAPLKQRSNQKTSFDHSLTNTSNIIDKSSENEAFYSLAMHKPSFLFSSHSKNELAVPLKPLKPSPLPSIKKISSEAEFDEKFASKSKYFMKLMNYHHFANPENNNINTEDFLHFNKKRRSPHNSKKPIKSFFIANNTSNINIHNNNDISSPSKKNLYQKDSPHVASINHLNAPRISVIIPSFEGSPINIKFKAMIRKGTRNCLSIADLTMKRIMTVSNYKEVLPVLKRLERNLIEYTNAMGFNERSSKILKSMLSKKIEMKHIFFNEEDGKLFEPISFFLMEEGIIIKERIYENGKFFNKFRVEPLMINELGVLNDKLEEMNNTKYIDELRLTKDSLLMEYKKMKELENEMMWNTKLKNMERLPKFNFEIMPNIQLMKSLEEFERQYGDFNLIDKKNRMIGKVLEEVLGEMKKNTVSNTGESLGWRKKSKPNK